MLRGKGIYILVALVTAAAVIAGGLYAVQFVPVLLSKGSGEEVLAEWARENLNAEVKAGWIAPVTMAGLGLQVRDLELEIKDASGKARPLFRAKSIQVLADSSELIFNRRLVWKEIIIEEPRVVISRGGDRKWNVAKWAKDLPIKNEKKDEAKKAQEPSLAKWMAKDMLRENLPASRDEWLELLVLERFEIKNGSVYAEDHASGKRALLAPLSLHGINLKITGATVKDPIRLDLSVPMLQGGGVKPSSTLRLAATLKLGQDLDQPSLIISSLSGGWEQIRLHNVSGRLNLKPLSFSSNVDLTFGYESFKRIATWAPVAHSKTLPFTSGHGDVRVTARVWGPVPERRFKVHYEGKAQVMDVTFDPGRVVAAIEGFNGEISLEDGAIALPPVDVIVGGSKLHGQGRIVEQQFPRFEIDLMSDDVDFAKFFVGRKLKQRYGKGLLPMKTEWGGHMKLGRGCYKKMCMSEAEGVWDIRADRVLKFPELRFNACGGSYVESGRSFVNFNNLEAYNFRFDGRIRDMDMTQFVDQLFNTTVFLHGKASADGYVTGKFVGGKFSPRELGGKLDLTTTGGYFEGFNPIGAALSFFKAPLPNQLKGLGYDRMHGLVIMNRGVASTDNLTIDAPGLKGEVKGWIDFAAKRCDLKIKVILLGEVGGLFKALPIVGEPVTFLGQSATTVYLRAHGHWDYLEYSPWSPLEDSMPALPEVPEEEPAPEVRDGGTAQP